MTISSLSARLKRALTIFGPATLARILSYRLALRRLLPLFENEARRKLDAGEAEAGQPTLVVRATLDLSYPYAQRVQHLARAVAAQGARVVYVTPAHGHDRVFTAREVAPGLILTPHLDAALGAAGRPVLLLLSTDGAIPQDIVGRVSKAGGYILYDYIDHLDDAVSSHPLAPAQLALHRRLIAREADIVVVTAEALREDAERLRGGPVALITNGVEDERFRAVTRERVGLRADFASIVGSGRPIVGYFGSFASWFDYRLIKAAAQARPDYAFVLIGPDLDGTGSAFAGAPANLYVLPAMRYDKLPSHATWFDAALLPFRVNDITLATSPLKIFEYMSLGLATASTDLPECRKYASVIIGRDEAGFVRAIDEALERGRDGIFRNAARAEGEANSWRRKAQDILAAIRER